MPMRFPRDRSGSATAWFAYAAAAIVITAAIGAHGLAWLANSGRVPVIAFLPLDGKAIRSTTGADVDPSATGTIRPTPANGR